jgi:hypothetical protein
MLDRRVNEAGTQDWCCLTPWRSAAAAKRPSVCIALLGGTGENGTTPHRRKKLGLLTVHGLKPTSSRISTATLTRV